MRVIEITTPGGPEVLRLAERPRPEPGPGEVLVRVVAAGVNRPDVQQRRGFYPPPPGASDIPGLDIAGVVEAVGADVDWPRPGDAVCALVTGGGYAEHCVVPAPQCMPLPEGFGFVQAAALPEVFMTAWNNLIWLGRLAEGETVLMQGGTSGVGLAVIQIARHLRRARVFATAGTAEKRNVLAGFGVEAAVDYHGDWDTELRRLTGGRGFDVIVDGQAGPYTARQMDLLAEDGRLVLLASHLGTRAEIDLRAVVRRRLTLTGSTLRPRPPAYKGRLARELIDQVWPLLADGSITMPICATFPLDAVAEAHAVLDANAQIGKVVLVVDPAGV
ncbi:NAD(P)H-quinone oxidoreductase [Rhodoplanes sp. SY1]|uniref:NAD(P)H-quinone oxidoreductase n=1 Tax=Rhodoplanes sp. SY1 TaxID=3166646 RepID=UPI0038B54C30